MSKFFINKNVWQKVVVVTKSHPLVRGMISYGLIWPTGSLIQQTIEGKEHYDFKKAIKFSIYGSLYVAPTLTAWMALMRHMFPLNNLTTAFGKALLEQISYGPFATASFYFIMTLMDRRGISEATLEVSEKFLPTYKVAVMVWPIVQTVNYTLIAEKNRVVFVSVISLLWTTFLAYMKHLEHSDVRLEHQGSIT